MKSRLPMLTLWQPWASLIAHGHKPLENRNWAPPRNLFGRRFGIHAGKTIDPGFIVDRECTYEYEEPFLQEALAAIWPDRFDGLSVPLGDVVGTARLAGLIDWEKDTRFLIDDADPDAFTRDIAKMWASGDRYCWLFDKANALEHPIQMRGQQGIWWWDEFYFCERCGHPIGDGQYVCSDCAAKGDQS